MTCRSFTPRLFGHVPCPGPKSQDNYAEPDWPPVPTPYGELRWTWNRHHGHYTAIDGGPRGVIHYAYRYNCVADHYEVIRAGEVLAKVGDALPPAAKPQRLAGGHGPAEVWVTHEPNDLVPEGHYLSSVSSDPWADDYHAPITAVASNERYIRADLTLAPHPSPDAVARLVEALENALASGLPTVVADDCRAALAACKGVRHAS